MQKINEIHKKVIRPEKIIQFGEGGFLRGFADWMIQKINEEGKYNGSVVVVQPIEMGMCDKLAEQDCVYTHVMRGLENGKPVVRKEIIDVISRCVKPYDDYESYLSLAENPDFEVIISNTTEAGISFNENDELDSRPAISYPAKLTQLLYKRFKLGLKGFLLLPCELIDKNGENLKKFVLKYAEKWNLEPAFSEWIEKENTFCNTLVDRIVTGYPKDEDMELGYIDNMVNTSEVFHLWVIEGDMSKKNILPFDEIGLNVLWTDKLENYRTRKVRILNGAHTSLVPYAMLRGFETVGQCAEDPEMSVYLKHCIYDEIIPTLTLPKEELIAYADDVLERFKNPFIRHLLSSIVLNSVSKFKVRVLPSLMQYKEKFGEYPEHLIMGFDALLKLYKTDMANDDKAIMAKMKTASLDEILADTSFWGEDLSCLKEEIVKCL